MNYVENAERVMNELYNQENDDFRGRRQNNKKITTSQIRNLLSCISDIYNDVVQLGTEELTENIKNRILYLKVQFVYEAGRDDKVKNFIEKTEIIRYIDEALKGKSKFIEMERYMEALVAYHRFYGGKDE